MKIKPANSTLASLEQKSQLAKMIAKRKLLRDSVVESLNSVLTSALFCYAGVLFGDYVVAKSPQFQYLFYSIAEEYALRHLKNDKTAYYQILKENLDPYETYKKFHKVISVFNSELNLLGPNADVDMSNVYKKIMTESGVSSRSIINIFQEIFSQGLSDSNYFLQVNFVLLLMVTTPFIRQVIFDPVLKKVLYRSNLKSLNAPSQSQLMDEKAKRLLLALSIQYQSENTWAVTAVRISQIFSFVAILYLVAIYYSDNKYAPMGPEVTIALYSNLFSYLKNTIQAYRAYRAEEKMNDKLITAKNTFSDILSATGESHVIRGKTLADCYMLFKSKNYKEGLSDILVNQIVKDILLNKGIKIIEYNNRSFTFEIKSLSKKEILSIKELIQSYVERYIGIKKLAKQLQDFFCGQFILQNIHIFKNLPTAKYSVNYSLTNAKLECLKKYLKNCIITVDEANLITITGHTPSKFPILYGEARDYNLSINPARFPSSQSDTEIKVEDAIESEKKYFILIADHKKNSDVSDLLAHIENSINSLKQKLLTRPNLESFIMWASFKFDNAKSRYFSEIEEEDIIIENFKTLALPALKKSHLQVARNIAIAKKEISEICTAVDDKLQSIEMVAPRSRPFSVLNTFTTLFAPTTDEINSYQLLKTEFISKLVRYTEFKMDYTLDQANQAVTIDLQTNAILFEIMQLMKKRKSLHAQLRKDPIPNFSKDIHSALEHCKGFLAELLDKDSLEILLTTVIPCSRLLIGAVTTNNFTTVVDDGFCNMMLAHAALLKEQKEEVSESDSLAYTYSTARQHTFFSNYAHRLPADMQYSALCMVNSKAQIYDGFDMPLAYLKKLCKAPVYTRRSHP